MRPSTKTKPSKQGPTAQHGHMRPCYRRRLSQFLLCASGRSLTYIRGNPGPFGLKRRWPGGSGCSHGSSRAELHPQAGVFRATRP